MKKIILVILAFAMTFTLGFAFNSITKKNGNSQPSIKKVTGIGGIFFKCKDPKKMRGNINYFFEAAAPPKL